MMGPILERLEGQHLELFLALAGAAFTFGFPLLRWVFRRGWQAIPDGARNPDGETQRHHGGQRRWPRGLPTSSLKVPMPPTVTPPRATRGVKRGGLSGVIELHPDWDDEAGELVPPPPRTYGGWAPPPPPPLSPPAACQDCGALPAERHSKECLTLHRKRQAAGHGIGFDSKADPVVSPDWLNAVQEELAYVISSSGLTLEESAKALECLASAGEVALPEPGQAVRLVVPTPPARTDGGAA